MKNVHVKLLLAMVLAGIFYAHTSHYLIMPLFLNNLILYCFVMGGVFGLANYLIAIKYIELKEKKVFLEERVYIDKLTHLHNRRAFDEEMSNIHETFYSMIFIDIDDFRIFNNKYGHDAGDKVLKLVAKSIRTTIRSQDKVFRYGGEEIVVLLMHCEKENAFKIAENIRLNIESLKVGSLPKVTISLGVASYPIDGSNSAEVKKACDFALLEAKKKGKNKTISVSSDTKILYDTNHLYNIT